MALWEGRFKKKLDAKTNDFNSSIRFDSRMYQQDILGSIAHVKMLAKQNIIENSEAEKIQEELNTILVQLNNESLKIDWNVEDIHTFIEGELTRRLGETGKRLHTARSRNDQVALDIRMYLKEEIIELINWIKQLIKVLLKKADENLETVMPRIYAFAKGTTYYFFTLFNGIL